MLRSRRGKLLDDTLLQLLLRILLSSSLASAGMSSLLPCPISALLLLLLELGGILVTMLHHAELVSSLLVGRDVDDSLSSAGFPSHVKSATNCLQISQFREIGFRSQELDDSLHGLWGFSDEHHRFNFTGDDKPVPI